MFSEVWQVKLNSKPSEMIFDGESAIALMAVCKYETNIKCLLHIRVKFCQTQETQETTRNYKKQGQKLIEFGMLLYFILQ